MDHTPGSERVLLSAPMSFTGARERIRRATWDGRGGRQRALLFLPALIALTLAVVAVLVWYVLAFTVFGIFMIPWRFHTRGKRRDAQAALRHREMLDAMGSR